MLTSKVVSEEHSGFWGKCMLFQSVKKRKSVRKKAEACQSILYWMHSTTSVKVWIEYNYLHIMNIF